MVFLFLAASITLNATDNWCRSINQLERIMQYSVENFKTDLEAPYAWPGGYPRYFITSDGAALSYKTASENKNLIVDAIQDKSNDGWRVIGCDVNWEDANLTCDHSGEAIEAAYV